MTGPNHPKGSNNFADSDKSDLFVGGDFDGFMFYVNNLNISLCG